MKVQRLGSEDIQTNNLPTSAQITTKIEKGLYNNLFIDYFDKQQHISILEKKYNMCGKKIKYELYKTGFTQNSYLRYKYSKDFLENLIKGKTFEECAKKLGITLGVFRNLLKDWNIKRDTSEYYLKNRVNTSFFSTKESEKEFYYFLGLFITDGCFVSNCSRIVIKNEGSLELLNSIANYAGHNNVKTLKGGYNSLIFTSKELKERMISIGVPEKEKTYNTKSILIPNKECLLSFLCGCLDGDGTIGYQKSPYGYRTSLDFTLVNYNIEFLFFLQKELEKIGYKSTVKKHKGSIPSLFIGTRNNSKEFFREMYNVSPFFLKSKYDLYVAILNRDMI